MLKLGVHESSKQKYCQSYIYKLGHSQQQMHICNYLFSQKIAMRSCARGVPASVVWLPSDLL